ncbi:MAG: hypothetical protein MJ151_00140 [Lachnospiraceae bacterium]|nr:hypothetical protein [Lachnospiraceae bacterium]
MSKSKFNFDAFDDMLKDIERLGGSSKEIAENALKKARDQINDEVKQEMPKHRRTGMTESSIKDAPIEWDGLVAKIPIGFDIDNGGYPSLFLVYGTPKMAKDEKLSKILDKRKGYRDKVLKEKMNQEYEKFMKKYM